MSNHDSSTKNTIKVQIDPHDGVVDISIVDNGPGIPKDFINKVFTPFMTKDKTGLGLSLVASIVSAHNGEVSVYNNTDEGITMKLRFPISI